MGQLRLVRSGNFWLSDTPDIPGSNSWHTSFPRLATWGLFEEKAGHPDQRIDWMFEKGFTPLSFATITDNQRGLYPSDHFPIFATLQWTGRRCGRDDSCIISPAKAGARLPHRRMRKRHGRWMPAFAGTTVES